MDSEFSMQRVAVTGTTGSGKTRFSRTLANALGAEHTELDGLNWGPDWTMRPAETFVEMAAKAASRERWVIDGNYAAVRPSVWGRADTLIWLDFPFWIVISRLFRRTVRRVFTGEEIFSGNRERFRTAFLSRESLFLWAAQTHWLRRKTYPLEFAKPEFRHLRIVHLRSPREANRFLDSLETRGDRDKDVRRAG